MSVIFKQLTRFSCGLKPVVTMSTRRISFLSQGFFSTNPKIPGWSRSFQQRGFGTGSISLMSGVRSGGTLVPKKRMKRKLDYDEDSSFSISAYAVCDEIQLENVRSGLVTQGLYSPSMISDDLDDVIHLTARYATGDESREMFLFRNGTVVFWNMARLERINVLNFLKSYQLDSYEDYEVSQECENMAYGYNDGVTRLVKGTILLSLESETKKKILEKYAFSNALTLSVKLGIWESELDRFADSIEHITEELKRAEHVKLSREQVLQKTGELFALRHKLNLNSDLLDTPDFYWERESLETMYQKTCNYLSIERRTKVMNEKLTQCCELLDLISNHLTDQHHTRLEWMIIALITVEVGFEILHVLERHS